MMSVAVQRMNFRKPHDQKKRPIFVKKRFMEWASPPLVQLRTPRGMKMTAPRQPQRGCDHSAQGWRSNAYPGYSPRMFPTLSGLYRPWPEGETNSIQPLQGRLPLTGTQGSSF